MSQHHNSAVDIFIRQQFVLSSHLFLWTSLHKNICIFLLWREIWGEEFRLILLSHSQFSY
ncbi:hypothetical protein E2C01_050607 [Portunus trituberculatus]|uniref:Uncharacterized protein n=1 Tax=Portunus trituberculatus TaxID=210409 RepID=A0A5B7GCK2_PORTR|nr:hypothetical protein [Portunus trituberculatus]